MSTQFTCNLITNKSNHICGLITYEILCELAKNPDVIDDEFLKDYKIVKNGLIDKERFNFVIRNEFIAGWANCLNLKCKPSSLRQHIGQQVYQSEQPTNQFINESYIQKLEAREAKGAFSILFADIDEHNFKITDVQRLINIFLQKISGSKYSDEFEYLIYSTKSSRENNKRWRVIIPIKGLVGLSVFKAAQKLLQKTLKSDAASALNPYQSFLFPLEIDNSYMPKSYYECASPCFSSSHYFKPQVIESAILNHFFQPLIDKKISTYSINTVSQYQLMGEPNMAKTFTKSSSLIDDFKRLYSVSDILSHNGYAISEPRNGSRQVSIRGTGIFDHSSYIYEDSGLFYTFQTNHPLYNDGRAMNSFDVMRKLECGGNFPDAYRKARTLVSRV